MAAVVCARVEMPLDEVIKKDWTGAWPSAPMVHETATGPYVIVDPR